MLDESFSSERIRPRSARKLPTAGTTLSSNTSFEAPVMTSRVAQGNRTPRRSQNRT